MECAQLKALRREATVVFKDLTLCRRHAREHATANASEATVASALLRSSDFEVYLQRRLARSTARIEAHLTVHGCQG